MDIGRTLARAHTEGWQHVQDGAVDAGRGVVLALPHSGNWDVAGLWLVQQGYPFSTVAERLRPESLFDQFVAYREGLGMRVIPLTGGDRPPMQVLAERLRAGEVVCLVADRDLSRQGVPVDFFGEPTRMPAGPALLAATTGGGAAAGPPALHRRRLGPVGRAAGRAGRRPAARPGAAGHPGAGRRLRRADRAAPGGLAHAAAAVAGRPGPGPAAGRERACRDPPRTGVPPTGGAGRPAAAASARPPPDGAAGRADRA